VVNDIYNKTKTVKLFSVGSYGKELSISSMQLAIGTGSKTFATTSALKQMNLKVNYIPHKVKTDGTLDTTVQNFIVPINVFLDNAQTNIVSCYSDLQFLLKQAVQNACLGSGAHWIPAAASGLGIGSCEHVVQLLKEDLSPANPAAGAFLCPVGQFLRRVNTTSVGQVGQWVFSCASVSSGAACGPWKYLDSIAADGTANCRDIRDIFTTTGFMVIQNGSYLAFSLACPPNTILQSVSGGVGGVNCVNPRLNYTCPVNQYPTAINGAGGVTCTYSSNSNSCASGSTYITAIDSAGNVTCGSGSLPGCAANQVITGINAAGAVICSAMP
jgi:hypothetical protein